MDDNLKKHHKSLGGDAVDLGSDEVVELSEVDRRLLMYKNLRL